MPFDAKKPCKGCGKAVDSGYCDACRESGAARETRPTAAQRGYGARWQKASAAYLRAHPLCADPCGVHKRAQMVVAATNVDHVKPHKGDMTVFWDADNWQGLCDSCHSYKTATEDGGFGRY